MMLLPEKGETQAHFKSRLTDMVKNDVYDPKQRAQMEKLLLNTMPPTPISSKDRQAAKEFREALAASIMADPVGFLAEVAGGYVGAKLLGSTLNSLNTKVKMELSQADRLEVLMKQPWSGGTAASESEWWLNQVVDDLVDNLNPDKTLGRKWKSLTYKQRFDKSMTALRARDPGVNVNPWALALATPGAYSAIRDGLRDQGLTDTQIDQLLTEVMQTEEMTLQGVGPVVVYESPQAVAEFSGIKPSLKPSADVRADVDMTPLEIQVQDITLEQGVVQEITPIQQVPTETDKPTPSPKTETPKWAFGPDE